MAKKLSRAKADDPVAVFKLLSDRNRFRAVGLLAGKRGGLLVGDLAKALGMGHSAVSHQLSFLFESGMVVSRKEGRTVRYMIAPSARAQKIVRLMRSL